MITNNYEKNNLFNEINRKSLNKIIHKEIEIKLKKEKIIHIMKLAAVQ